VGIAVLVHLLETLEIIPGQTTACRIAAGSGINLRIVNNGIDMQNKRWPGIYPTLDVADWAAALEQIALRQSVSAILHAGTAQCIATDQQAAPLTLGRRLTCLRKTDPCKLFNRTAPISAASCDRYLEPGVCLRGFRAS
jgi:hypothetical protein